MSAARALVLGIGACVVVACSGAQDKAQVQLATITAGCKASLDLERDAGEAGAADDTTAFGMWLAATMEEK